MLYTETNTVCQSYLNKKNLKNIYQSKLIQIQKEPPVFPHWLLEDSPPS